METLCFNGGFGGIYPLFFERPIYFNVRLCISEARSRIIQSRDLTNSPRKNTVLTTIPLKAKIATTIAFWLTQTTCATMSQIVCLAGILKMTGSLMTTPVSQGTFGLNDILKNKFLECFGSKLLSTLSKTVKSWTSQVDSQYPSVTWPKPTRGAAEICSFSWC